jgi:hypothetical protein
MLYSSHYDQPTTLDYTQGGWSVNGLDVVTQVVKRPKYNNNLPYESLPIQDAQTQKHSNLEALNTPTFLTDSQSAAHPGGLGQDTQVILNTDVHATDPNNSSSLPAETILPYGENRSYTVSITPQLLANFLLAKFNPSESVLFELPWKGEHGLPAIHLGDKNVVSFSSDLGLELLEYSLLSSAAAEKPH